MRIEQEVSNKIYRLMELHQEFANGKYKEMNELYSDDFQGWLYMPRGGKVEKLDVKDIKEGNEEAANYYKGKKIQFNFSGLNIIPQHENQATASYEITFSDNENEKVVRALN
ncbi:hypothetical protein [Lentibacillus sediminis]|uniref:hypothetical protein n=1 Tax=Lentibacillus sediminis TaxID=1940529 RepID=UPI000C1BE05A|nr:hypothetical protein [Lentibacillus sediminis]